MKCQWAGVGGCMSEGTWFSHRLDKPFCVLHKIFVAGASVDVEDPPRCDQMHGVMVADWELDDHGLQGAPLWVCPTCCWSLPRRVQPFALEAGVKP